MTRDELSAKTNGRCGYCGEPLQKGWHKDHMEPVEKYPGTNIMKYPERDNDDNLIASCPSCNINKHSMSIEEFRAAIKQYVTSLNKRMVQYQMAKKYGLIRENIPFEITFYFEYLEHFK